MDKRHQKWRMSSWKCHRFERLFIILDFIGFLSSSIQSVRQMDNRVNTSISSTTPGAFIAHSASAPSISSTWHFQLLFRLLDCSSSCRSCQTTTAIISKALYRSFNRNKHYVTLSGWMSMSHSTASVDYFRLVIIIYRHFLQELCWNDCYQLNKITNGFISV